MQVKWYGGARAGMASWSVIRSFRLNVFSNDYLLRNGGVFSLSVYCLLSTVYLRNKHKQSTTIHSIES